eukprot:CAMPEP_0202434276 /NCGR_PEP_ID=MMETSP1345-20130828/14831_1 /ASSEMBLY_ACC=CAM_ASM_000843 /TAXON_ID=342563 /ORGANISM="Fabrea Fabrea salina" /LENGTH=362 /DNA_ID=CAMNT_0049046899 /DNA_START=161 /DNA_END=1249 /DNA_ORIENTATION=+
MAAIQWKLLEPFQETNHLKTRYGFRLGNQNNYQEFYTEDEQTLNNWLDTLSRVCILTEIEEEFKLLEKIGEGSFAKVYFTKGLRDAKDYAVKQILKKKLKKSKNGVERLIDEIKVMRDLKSEYIVKLHSIYESNDCVYLVLEYAGDKDLFQRIIERGAFSEEEAAKLIYRLLAGLRYMHSNNYVHRDIKLENLFITVDSDLKIGDLGLACSTKSKSMLDKCGSPGYVAPEMLKGKRYDSKVDMFSAGVVLFSLLSGTSPFKGEDPEEVLRKNERCKLVFEEENWRGVSSLAKSMVKELTQPNPSKRLSSFEALRHPWLLQMIPSSRRRAKSLASNSVSSRLIEIPGLVKDPRRKTNHCNPKV